MTKSKKMQHHTISTYKANPYSRNQKLKNHAEKRKHGIRAGPADQDSKGQIGHGKKQERARDNEKGMGRRPLPFDVRGNILCVGEGDFSFALSLLNHHSCTYLLATSYDDEETCYKKYPQARANIQALLDPATTTPGSSSCEKEEEAGDDGEERSGFSEDEGEEEEAARENEGNPQSSHVLFSVDAKSLSRGGCLPIGSSSTATPGTKLIRNPPFPFRSVGSSTGWDAILFNYPHVGGLSTDVNRQVRSNQALLVSFFKAAISLLSKSKSSSPEGGRILVSLFDCEPYTLWNIRDLARHCGLRVIESMRFPWDRFPGYRHVRTLGVVDGKGSAWRGEKREGRWYVFGVDGGEEVVDDRVGRGKGERKEDSSDDDDDE